MGIMAAIMFPVFGRVRESARRASCQSNMKQAGLAILQYMQDNDEFYPMCYNIRSNADIGTPFWAGWPLIISSYVKTDEIFYCPSLKRLAAPSYPFGGQGGYAFTFADAASPYVSFGSWYINMYDGGRPLHVTRLQRTSDTIMISEASYGPYTYNPLYNSAEFNNSARSAHFDGMNVIYADGHAKWGKVSAIKSDSKYWTY